MQRGIFYLTLLFVPSIEAASRPYLGPYAPVESALLKYYKSKLTYELSQMYIYEKSEFECRHILELRGELEAWRNLPEHLHFESAHILDYIELRHNGPDYAGSEEYRGMHLSAKGSPIACELNNGFVGCYFRNGTDSNEANLIFLTVHTHEHPNSRSVYEFGGYSRTFYTLRRMSKQPTWKLYACRSDAYQCSVSVRLVQLSSLDTFEAQLNRLDAMIEDIEEETVRLLKLKDQEDRNKEKEPRMQAHKDSSPYEFAESAFKPSSDKEEDPSENNQQAQYEPVEEGGYRDEL